MGAAKLVSLLVRPYQVSHLSFEVDGILETSKTQLGAVITTASAFDFPAFYATLRAIPTTSGDPSRLLYDFSAIDAAVAPFTLAALRSEPRKTALSAAISARQNAYFAKYANATAIISMMNNLYSPGVVESKPNRLANLRTIADSQFSQLQAAYINDGRLGVVRTTSSALNSETQTTEQSSETNTGTTEVTGSTNAESLTAPVILPASLSTLPAGGGSMAGAGFPSGDVPPSESVQEGTSGETSQSSETGKSQTSASTSQSQTIVNTDYGYRVPYLENAAQLERAQISLIDQQFAQFMYGQNLPNLATVFQNELNSMDGDVFRRQISYLSTVLMSPIAGTVTGIYKYPGDAVKAGEPVIRIEDNRTIFLLATAVYRGPVSIGSNVTVKTNLFDSSPSAATTLTGSVVAARGNGADDKWELVVKCSNPLDSASNPIFPVGYHFDYDDTTLSITP